MPEAILKVVSEVILQAGSLELEYGAGVVSPTLEVVLKALPGSKFSMGDVEATLTSLLWADTMDALPIASSVLSRETSKASTVRLSVKRPAPSDTNLSQTSAASSCRRIRGCADGDFRGTSSSSRSLPPVGRKDPLDPSDDLPCLTSPHT